MCAPHRGLTPPPCAPFSPFPAASSPAVGKSIQEAGLRHLDGQFVVAVRHQSKVLHAVDPSLVLSAGDVLYLSGESVILLCWHRSRGASTSCGRCPQGRAGHSCSCVRRAVISSLCAAICPFHCFLNAKDLMNE